MRGIVALADHFAPDSIVRLERAAQMRYDDADKLLASERRLGAVYLLGYSIEMCLAAAYFRSAGFAPHVVIDRETRRRRMAQARQQTGADGEVLMNADPHPLLGWARFLEWHRSTGELSASQKKRLREAREKARQVYRQWRPELRYKMNEVSLEQAAVVRRAALWFIDQQRRL